MYIGFLLFFSGNVSGDYGKPCVPFKGCWEVTSGRTWFLVSYFVGSQDFPEMTIFENGLKSMLHNTSNSDMPSTKKHKVFRKWTKMYSEETDRRYGHFQVGKQQQLPFSTTFLRHLFYFREGSCDHIQLLTIRWLERANVVWHGTHVWLTCDLCPEMKLFCRSFFTSMEGEVFSKLGKSISNLLGV